MRNAGVLAGWLGGVSPPSLRRGEHARVLQQENETAKGDFNANRAMQSPIVQLFRRRRSQRRLLF
jgi:hypothetical protein